MQNIRLDDWGRAHTPKNTYGINIPQEFRETFILLSDLARKENVPCTYIVEDMVAGKYKFTLLHVRKGIVFLLAQYVGENEIEEDMKSVGYYDYCPNYHNANSTTFNLSDEDINQMKSDCMMHHLFFDKPFQLERL